jgi:hypothetical protein
MISFTGTASRWQRPDKPMPAISTQELNRMRSLLTVCERDRCGLLADLVPDERADTIIYIDVLEQIDNDEGEMRVAASRLAPGGNIVALSPAFNSLYDEAIGHYRRYARKDARRLTVRSLTLQTTFFLDSAGFFASALNWLILWKSQPSVRDIQI